jgi:GTPase SAR1 family protein
MPKSVFLSLAEATRLVTTVGHTNTILIEGPPGIGKSSILKSFSEDKFERVYLDAAVMEPSDLLYPMADPAKREVEFVPNALMKLRKAQASGKPIVVMVDELGKAPKAVMNALLPLLLEKRIGAHYLPEGSVVFATTNLATDGVGDNIPAHARNRITTVHCYGPKAQEWVQWGVENKIDPVILAWVNENPQALDCYAYSLTGIKAESNPYIFNPQKGVTKTFTSARSLAHSGSLVSARNSLGDSFQAALAGTVGASAAADIQAFVSADDSLATWNDIMKDPMKAKLPEGIAVYVQAIKCASLMTRENHEKVEAYVSRWEADEGKAVFITNYVRRGNEALIVMGQSKSLSEMTTKFMNYTRGA